MNTYLSKSKILVLALTAIVGTTLAASAFKVDLKDDEGKTGIFYLGLRNDLPVYRLALKNKIKDTYFVSISNKEGKVIYCEQIDGANIVCDFKFDNKVYKNADDLTFSITDLKGKTVGIYQVDRAQKTVSHLGK